MPTAMLGDLRPVQPSGGPRRPRRLLVPALAAAALLAVVAVVILLRTHSNGNVNGATATNTTPPASSQAARRHAAAQLSALLAQSVTDRADVINASADVRSCGSSLPQDARTFAKAASSRQRLLSRLGSMPGRSLLSAAMLRDLTGAWQASAQADTDLAQWADDKIAHGCPGNGGSDAILRASYGPDAQADANKRAFAGLWDPVARQYGLTQYQWNQL